MLRARTVWLASAMLLMLGCAPSDAGRPANAVDAVPVGEGPAPAALAALDTAALHTLAAQALDSRNTYAPAGRNAVEYYLAIRDKAPAEAAVQSALVELQPYVLIAGEQAIAGGDLEEASRLIVLLGRMDGTAPALPRLRKQLQTALEASVAAAALAELDDARVEPRALASEPAVGPAPSGTLAVESERATVDRLVSIGREPVQRPAAVARQGAGTLSRATAAAPPGTGATPDGTGTRDAGGEPSPAAVARRAPLPVPQPDTAPLPRLLKDVPPRYPIIALNRRIEGRVQVTFSIGADGTVSGARVVSATPESVFDKAALAAVAQWRFEATGRSVTTTRTLNFNLGRQG